MKVLLAEPSLTFFEEYDEELSRRGLSLDYCQTGRDAQVKISNDDYFCVLLNPDIKQHSGWEVLNFIRSTKPLTRVILLCESMEQLDEYIEITEKMPVVASLLAKPVDLAGLVSAINGENELSGWKGIVASDSDGSADTEEVEGVEGQDFIGMALKEFVSGNVAVFDLFIQLKTGRFLKLFKAGDKYDKERLQSYSSKGIDKLYFKKEDRSAMVNYMNSVLEVMVKSNVEESAVVSTTKNNITFFIDQAHTEGVNPALMEEGKRLSELTIQVVQKNPDLSRTLNEYFADMPYQQAKAFTTCIYACIISSRLEWIPQTLMKELTMASLFMDIGLSKLSKQLADKAEFEMDDAEFEEYKKHPSLSSKYVEKLRGANERIRQMVYQHHEKINGSGFPNQLSGIKIYPPAKILSLASDFAELLLKCGAGTPLEKLNEFIMDRETIQCYDSECLKALIVSFINKDNKKK